MSIEPIKFNYMQYGEYNKEEQKNDKGAKNLQENTTPKQPQKEVSPSDVLNFMSNYNYVQKPKVEPKQLDVSSYVNSEQAQRIAESVRTYDDNIESIKKMIISEFSKIDEKSAMALAVSIFNENNL